MRKTEPLLGGSIPNTRPFGDASSSPRFDAGESSVIQSTVLTSCGTAGGLTAFGAGPSISMTDFPDLLCPVTMRRTDLAIFSLHALVALWSKRIVFFYLAIKLTPTTDASVTSPIRGRL